MNNTQRKLCSKYMKLAERNQKHADELKSHMSGMTSYGGWDVGYHTGYSTGVSNLIDELLAAESEKEGNSESQRVQEDEVFIGSVCKGIRNPRLEQSSQSQVLHTGQGDTAYYGNGKKIKNPTVKPVFVSEEDYKRYDGLQVDFMCEVKICSNVFDICFN